MCEAAIRSPTSKPSSGWNTHHLSKRTTCRLAVQCCSTAGSECHHHLHRKCCELLNFMLLAITTLAHDHIINPHIQLLVFLLQYLLLCKVDEFTLSVPQPPQLPRLFAMDEWTWITLLFIHYGGVVPNYTWWWSSSSKNNHRSPPIYAPNMDRKRPQRGPTRSKDRRVSCVLGTEYHHRPNNNFVNFMDSELRTTHMEI